MTRFTTADDTTLPGRFKGLQGEECGEATFPEARQPYFRGSTVTCSLGGLAHTPMSNTTHRVGIHFKCMHTPDN